MKTSTNFITLQKNYDDSNYHCDQEFNTTILNGIDDFFMVDFAKNNILQQELDLRCLNFAKLFVRLNNLANDFYFNVVERSQALLVLNASNSANVLVNLAPHAHLKVIILLTSNTTSNINFLFNANLKSHAHLEVFYATLAFSDLKVNVNNSINHFGSKSISDIQFFGTALEKSFIKAEIFSNVVKEAAQCEVNQVIKNIILDKQASAQGRPVLKIFNNDVIAHHGCALGQISQEQLFYLMSRGLTYQQSLVLLINSFFNSVINQIPHQTIKDEFFNFFVRRFNAWKKVHKFD